MFRAPDWLNVFLHWAHLCGFSPLWVSICIFRFPASLIELLHCVHLYSFTTYYVKLETLPDSLKNLGASYWVISEKRSVWESYERLRNVYYQKNNAAHLQNRDALRSQPCTFAIGPGSGWPGEDVEGCFVPAAHQIGRSSIQNILGNSLGLPIHVLRAIWIFSLQWCRRFAPPSWLRLHCRHCISHMKSRIFVSFYRCQYLQQTGSRVLIINRWCREIIRH